MLFLEIRGNELCPAHSKLTLGAFWPCFWPQEVPGYLGEGLSSLSSALWRQYPVVVMVRWWLCGRVPDLQSGGCGFESRPGLLRTKVYSAFHPSGVGKWVPVIAEKAKAGMAHSDCGWTCGCAGKTVKSLENTCHTWALCGDDSPWRGAISSVRTFTFTFTACLTAITVTQ